MSIITQAGLTSLRSLKYGQDTPGGGNSGEPYITQSIPSAFKQQVDSTNIWNSDNGLIRGGFVGAARASLLDTLRIGKFLVNAPRGPLFIAKQVGLQLSNPRLETKQLSTNNTGIFGAILNVANRINNAVGPTRIYNLGINTLAQIPIAAFGGHIIRHGFLPVMANDQKYASVVVANDGLGTNGISNRLVQLKVKLQQDPNANISKYIGGPGSTDGIGTTTIRRYVTTLSNKEFTPNSYKRPVPTIDYYKAQGLSEEYFNGNISEIADLNHFIPKTDFSDSTLTEKNQIDQNVINYNSGGKKYNTLKSAIDNQISGSQIGRTIKNLTTDLYEGNPDLTPNATGPISFVYTGRSKYKNMPLGGDGGFNIDYRLGLSGAHEEDQINLTPLYSDNTPPGTTVHIDGKPHKVRDLIKFRIEAIDNDKPEQSVWMIFRAYLKDITDDPNPSWNTVTYTGRGEPFYIYKGFERTVSFTFQVAAMSEKELEPMWQKLNYLYSNVMPDYSNGIMRGPYMKLTIGNYMYRQPGIIKSLSYTIDDKSPWEISIDDPERKQEGGNPLYELPHLMNVRMTFAPIHDFLPRKFPSTYDNNWQGLPAFVVDRNDNNNRWLTDVFNGDGGKKIIDVNSNSK